MPKFAENLLVQHHLNGRLPRCTVTVYNDHGWVVRDAYWAQRRIDGRSCSHRWAMHPVIAAQLTRQLDLDSINFLSNDRPCERLEDTTATPEPVAEAMRINEEAWPCWPSSRPAGRRITGLSKCRRHDHRRFDSGYSSKHDLQI